MAQFFVWKESYSVGVKRIDDQHKRLLDLVNGLYTSFTEDGTTEKLKDILDHLVDYSQYHFNTEEQYFIESGYPQSKKHIDEHKKFGMKMKMFVKDLGNGDSSVTYKLMSFLREWLIDHFEKEDQDYSAYLQKYEKNVYRSAN